MMLVSSYVCRLSTLKTSHRFVVRSEQLLQHIEYCLARKTPYGERYLKLVLVGNLMFLHPLNSLFIEFQLHVQVSTAFMFTDYYLRIEEQD